MFFGKKRGKKPPPPKRRDDYETGGFDDDFGFEEEGTDRSRPPSPSPPEIEEDDSFVEGDRPLGRSLEDATFVGRPSSPQAPPPSPTFEDDDDLDLPHPIEEDVPRDATVFINRPVAPTTTVVGWLVSASGASRGRDFRLAEDVTRIGTSEDCHVRLPGDKFVSTRHAEIRVDSGTFVLRDLDSTNGTFRNDEPVREVGLADGDRIRFGLSDFLFKCVNL